MARCSKASGKPVHVRDILVINNYLHDKTIRFMVCCKCYLIAKTKWGVNTKASQPAFTKPDHTWPYISPKFFAARY